MSEGSSQRIVCWPRKGRLVAGGLLSLLVVAGGGAFGVEEAQPPDPVGFVAGNPARVCEPVLDADEDRGHPGTSPEPPPTQMENEASVAPAWGSPAASAEQWRGDLPVTRRFTPKVAQPADPDRVARLIGEHLGRNPRASEWFSHRFPIAAGSKPSPTALFLRSGSLDTTPGGPNGLGEPPAALKTSAFAGGREREVVVVQLRGPILSAYPDILTEIGCEILGYVPNNAYLLRVDRGAWEALQPDRPSPKLAELSEARGVRTLEPLWAAVYQPQWKLTLDLEWLADAAPGVVVELTAVLHPGEHTDSVLRALETLGAAVLSTSDSPTFAVVRFDAFAGVIPAVAQLPEVSAIERYVEPVLLNNVARTSASIPTGRGASAGPLMDVENVWVRGIRGEGQVVAVLDSGLDTGDFATLHPDFGQAGSASNPLRVVGFWYDTLSTTGWFDDETGHGTHVAGSVLGNGSQSGASPGSNLFPSTSYAGTAPKAGLFVEKMFPGIDSGFADLSAPFAAAFYATARIHSNS